jgi:EAL domain-containing protein (putative c-di-GMP-specific phosphodiesterase class I)
MSPDNLQTFSVLKAESRLATLVNGVADPFRGYDTFVGEVPMDNTASDYSQFDIVEEAERGLNQKEFFLVFQPQLRMPDEKLSGFEALLRWRHPALGVLMPSSFIGVVENSRLSGRFTDFLLARAAETLADWAACNYAPLSLAINLPVRELVREDLPEKVVGLLASHAVDTAKLQIELTESTEPGPLIVLAAAIDSVRATGVRVAIDDFGAGYWSLSALHRLAVDVLKIDRSLINNIPESSQATIVLEALIRLGQRLGKQIVIEGIETAAQFAWTKAMSQVDCQGYYICRPVCAAQIDDLVREHGLVKSTQCI